VELEPLGLGGLVRSAQPPATPDPCRSWWGCAAYGSCASQGPECRPGSHEDCRKSWACEQYGYCAIHDGYCAPAGATDAGCRVLGKEGFDACADHGRCEAVRGRCLATRPEHCRASARCKDRGHCTPVDGTCQLGAQTDADCEKAMDCRVMGRCRAKGGRCVAASDEDCAKSEDCRLAGRCARHGTGCVATRPEHCSGSQMCESAYECTLELGGCHASAADCQRAEECDGGCQVVRGQCDIPRPPFIFFQF